MTRLTHHDLIPFYRNSIGIDRLFDTIQNRVEGNTAVSNYPPYNIVKVDENNYLIEVAVAGFKPGEINVQTHNGQLIIIGEKPIDDQSDRADIATERMMLYQGIGTRRFTRTFDLSEYVEVQTAHVESGILTVALTRVVPESMKPKNIKIEYQI